MEKDAVFHPRYSVRNAFDDGVVSVADGRYSVGKHDKNKPEPRSMTCYNPDGRPVVFAKGQQTPSVNGRQVQANYPEVQSNPNPIAKSNTGEQLQTDTAVTVTRRGINRNRMDRTRQEPNPGDRRYWKSKDVVNADIQVDRVQKQQEVAKPRWQVLPYDSERKPRSLEETSTKEDRQHWMGQTVVQGGRSGGQQAHSGIQQKIPVEAMTRKDLTKMGRRENHIQRQIRRRLTVKTATGVEVEIPEEALSGEEFTLVVPGGVDLEGQFPVQNNPLPSHLGVDTLRELEGRPVADDEDAHQNRTYWGSHDVVTGPGAKSRFLPKNE